MAGAGAGDRRGGCESGVRGWTWTTKAMVGWKEGAGIWMQLEEETTGQSVDEKTEAPDVVALPPSSCQVPTSPRHLHMRLPCSHACLVPGTARLRGLDDWVGTRVCPEGDWPLQLNPGD